MRWKMKWLNEQWNDETLEGLSKGVKQTKWPSALAYDVWKMKWWNLQWNDETLEGVSKSVKHTNGQVHWKMMKWTFLYKGVINYEDKICLC